MPKPAASTAATHHCPRCRHDLAGLPGVSPDADPTALLTCPECGTPTTIMAARDARPGNRGWTYFLLWVISVLMALLLASCVIGIVLSAVWSAVAPNP